LIDLAVLSTNHHSEESRKEYYQGKVDEESLGLKIQR
jgi:hypothetical protein